MSSGYIFVLSLFLIPASLCIIAFLVRFLIDAFLICEV